MKHGTTVTLLTCSFRPDKQLTDISETLTKKTVRTNRNREKIQPQQNEQYFTQIPRQTLQHHPPKKLQKLAPPMKPRKLQQHHDRMTKTGPTTTN